MTLRRSFSASVLLIAILCLIQWLFLPSYCETNPRSWGRDFWCDIKIADEIIALFTLGLLAFTALLWRSTDKLWEAGEKNLKSTQRAFVFLDGFSKQITLRTDADIAPGEELQGGVDPDLFVTRFAVHPKWRNSGNTPTVKMKTQIDWCGPGGTKEVGTYSKPEEVFFIGPQSTAKSNIVEMPSITSIIANSMNFISVPTPDLLIWGRATYEDVFGKEHWVQWCFKAIPERHRKGRRLKVHFVQAGNYNQSDSDE